MPQVRTCIRSAAMRAVCLAGVLAGLGACNRTDAHGDGGAKYVVRYFPNHIRKEEGLERNGKRDGIWTFYFDDTGNRCGQTAFVNGVRDGLSVGWHENGQVRVEGQFRNGEVSGTWVDRSEFGAKYMERVFEHNKATGPATGWFENGQMRSAGSFLHDMPDGEWSQWYAGGQIRSVGSYIKGMKQGPWDFFTETGEVDIELAGVYVDDELSEPRVRK